VDSEWVLFINDSSFYSNTLRVCLNYSSLMILGFRRKDVWESLLYVSKDLHEYGIWRHPLKWGDLSRKPCKSKSNYLFNIVGKLLVLSLRDWGRCWDYTCQSREKKLKFWKIGKKCWRKYNRLYGKKFYRLLITIVS